MHLRSPATRWSRAGLAVALVVAATTAGVGIASADGDAPAGNNGHIQVDEYDMDEASNGNDPHVACGFSVTFFGYDAGDQSASIEVDPSDPTDGGTPFSVVATWHTDERTGGNQLDANVQISPEQIEAALAGIEPAAQGYHVGITVEVSGSQGADVKHKMFWIEPCPTEVAAPPPPDDTVTANGGFATPEEAAAAWALAAGAIAPAVPATALSLAGSATG